MFKEIFSMKRILGLIICSGILFALSGCNASTVQPTATSPLPAVPAKAPTDSAATNNPAAASPLATPPAAGPTRNGQAQMMPGVIGAVISVDGSTITVKDSRQQGNVTVTLTDNTQVFKQATIAMTDVAVGEALNAMGNLNGDVFTAAQIQIGVDAAPVNAADMPRPAGTGQPGDNPPSDRQPPSDGQSSSDRQPPSGGQPPADGQAQPEGQLLSGTVKAVSGDALTIEAASGSTVQVRLNTNGLLVRRVAGTNADIAPNAQIMVMGEQSDAALAATWIEIIPALPQSGLFGSSLSTIINGVLLSFPQAFGGNQ
jgi:hypothetical protein